MKANHMVYLILCIFIGIAFIVIKGFPSQTTSTFSLNDGEKIIEEIQGITALSSVGDNRSKEYRECTLKITSQRWILEQKMLFRNEKIILAIFILLDEGEKEYAHLSGNIEVCGLLKKRIKNSEKGWYIEMPPHSNVKKWEWRK